MTRDGQHIGGLVAGQVEQHVRFGLVEGALQLCFVRPVEPHVAGEGAVGAILPARGDGFHAAAHQLLACGDPDEARAADDERAGQMSRAANSTSTPSRLSSRVAISRAITTERCLPPVHPNATTRLDRPRSR